MTTAGFVCLPDTLSSVNHCLGWKIGTGDDLDEFTYADIIIIDVGNNHP